MFERRILSLFENYVTIFKQHRRQKGVEGFSALFWKITNPQKEFLLTGLTLGVRFKPGL